MQKVSDEVCFEGERGKSNIAIYERATLCIQLDANGYTTTNSKLNHCAQFRHLHKFFNTWTVSTWTV